MFELVPSEYMRMLLKEKGVTFTDFQKAELIWNAPRQRWEEKLTALRELAGQTDNDALRNIGITTAWEQEPKRR